MLSDSCLESVHGTLGREIYDPSVTAAQVNHVYHLLTQQLFLPKAVEVLRSTSRGLTIVSQGRLLLIR